MKMALKWNAPIPTVADKATGGDKTLTAMAHEAKRLMEPYVPDKNGALYKNVRVYAEKGQGIVEYMSPYARYQFYGKLMVSSTTGSAWSRGEKKVLTDRDLVFSRARHPLATSRWDKAMKTARGDDFKNATQEIIRRGGA